MGAVFSIGMRQAFFSNEAGQGSSPIVHAAAKTDEPVREGLVAGLEPFIDTIVVCTLTGMVILVTGVWNRAPEFELLANPTIVAKEGSWEFSNTKTSDLKSVLQGSNKTNAVWKSGDRVSAVIKVPINSGLDKENKVYTLQSLAGTVVDDSDQLLVKWVPISTSARPEFAHNGVFRAYDGASLTAFAFEKTQPGLGKWLVTLATWLFGISTMISWSYYGEQGIRYLFGKRMVTPYRILFCLAILVSCSGIIQSRAELTNLVNLGTGVMLWVNVPITLFFAKNAIAGYHDYFKRMTED